MYVVISSSELNAEHKERFVRELAEVARISVEKEPGCLRLDVVQDGNDSNRIWVYEVFKDQATLDTHMQSPHYLKYREATKGCRVEGGVTFQAGPGASSIWPTDDQWK